MSKFQVSGVFNLPNLTSEWEARQWLSDHGLNMDHDETVVDIITEDVYWFTYNLAVKASSSDEAEDIFRRYIDDNYGDIWESAGSSIIPENDPRASYAIGEDDL